MARESKIGIEEAVDALLKSADFLRFAHEKLLEEWSPDTPPSTIVFSTFGECFCSHSPTSSETTLIRICKLIEELMSRGDDGVMNAVATGMLEAMLAESSAGRFEFETVTPFLGAHTKAFCRSWDEFTGYHTSGLYDGEGTGEA